MSVQLDAAFNYNDLQGLESLKSGVRKDSPEALKAVAQQFESMFIGLIMKSMRDATDVMASDLENSYQTKFYRDMHDQQLTLSLSQSGGFGLAEVLYEQISKAHNPETPDLFNIDVKSLDESIRPIIKAATEGSAYSRLLDHPAFKDVESNQFESAITGQEKSVNNPTDFSTQSVPFVPANSAEKGALFSSPQQFVEELMPMAEKAASAIGIEPKYLVAQAALETGWGKYVIKDAEGKTSFNFFGIKADPRWDGKAALTTTHEYIGGKRLTIKEPFRAYESAQDSFADYVRFVTESPRYEQAVASAQDGASYFKNLQDAGYATDPEYAEKIVRIAHSDLFANV